MEGEDLNDLPIENGESLLYESTDFLGYDALESLAQEDTSLEDEDKTP